MSSDTGKADSSEREALEAIIIKAYHGPRRSSTRAENAADAILAAGFSRRSPGSSVREEGAETPSVVSEEPEWDAAFSSPEFRKLAAAAQDEVRFVEIVRSALTEAPHSASKVAEHIRAALAGAPGAETPAPPDGVPKIVHTLMESALESLREPCSPTDRADARLLLDKALKIAATPASSAHPQEKKA